MFRKKKHLVGLSISPQNIVCAEVHIDSRGDIVVDRLGVVSTPPNTIEDDRVVVASAISRIIRELLADSGIKTQEVSLAIPVGNSVISRLLTLPSMSRRETLEALKGEVENYAALSSEEPVLDFQVVGQKVEGVRQRSEVLLVAVSEGIVNSYISAVESANLKLLSVEIIPLAILRALDLTLQKSEEKSDLQTDRPLMLVSIEENAGTVIIAQDETIQFIHNVEIGSKQLSDEGTLEELSNELITSINYYQTAFPQGGQIEKIFLLLDEPDNGVFGRLEEQVGIPVVKPQPVETADGSIAEKIASHSLSAYSAIGSAIRTAVSGRDGFINLIPSKKFEIANLKKQVLLAFLILCSFVLLSICASSVLKSRTNAIMEEIANIKREIERSDTSALTTVSDIEADVARLKTEADVTKYVISSVKRVNWVKVFPEISTIIPKTVWLTNFTWKEGDSATFAGYALAYDSVFKFIDTLTASSYFDSVKLVFIRRVQIKERPVLQFELKCEIRREQQKG